MAFIVAQVINELNNYSIYRMIKPNHIQFDHLQFIIPSPFLTQPRQSGSTIVNIHSKKQLNPHKPALAFTNICFKPNQQAKVQCQGNKRIHGRQTIKKIGQTKLFLAKQRKRQKGQNNLRDSIFKFVNQQIEMSSKQVLKSKNKSNRSSVRDKSMLELDSAMKSIEDNRKLKKRTTKSPFERLSIELSSSKYDEHKTQICCSVLQLQLKPFQNITNKIQVSEQKEKQETGFYKKLKNKIQRAMNKLEEKKNPNKENLLIEGCNSYQSSKPILQKRSLTDRLTPRTSVSRAGLQFKDHICAQKVKRPKTSRASTSERKEIQYLSARSNDLFSDEKRSKRSKRSTIGAEQRTRQFFIPNTHKTLKHVSPISKQANYAFSKCQIKQQEIKQKMLNILVDCDNQTEEFQNLQQGLTVFEQYTSQMSKGLLNMSRKLQSNTHMYQYTQF